MIEWMSRRLGLCCAGMLCLAVSNSQAQLVITEVMPGSSHPGVNQITGLGGLANGDWWELVNIGAAPVDMTGYVWDDNNRLSNPNGITQFPDQFVIQPNEAVLIVEEDGFATDINTVGGFRDAWDLPTSLRILSRDDMLGPDTFSGISSTNGDEVNLYDAGLNLVASVVTPAVGYSGLSLEWDSTGNSLGESVLGENGAYRALLDGSELPPPYPFLDIASPGIFVSPTGGVDGDFDDDGTYGCLDVNALVAEIASGNNTPAFDLNGDGQVDTDDLDDWLAEAGAANLTSGAAYLKGDADLNGSVDGSDFGVWNSHKFTAAAAWCQGDFNADGSIDGSDFGIWNTQKFTSADGASVVPEPCLGWLLGLIIAIAVRVRRSMG